jgi:hypothetical protein
MEPVARLHDEIAYDPPSVVEVGIPDTAHFGIRRQDSAVFELLDAV